MMTSSVEVETIDDLPLLGIKSSPLDNLGACGQFCRLECIKVYFQRVIHFVPLGRRFQNTGTEQVVNHSTTRRWRKR